jgi:hypothetical protein
MLDPYPARLRLNACPVSIPDQELRHGQERAPEEVARSPGGVTNLTLVPVSAVCISRTAGARGEEVGRLVADALGFRYVDEEIVLAAAEKEGVVSVTTDLPLAPEIGLVLGLATGWSLSLLRR